MHAQDKHDKPECDKDMNEKKLYVTKTAKFTITCQEN